MVGRERLRGGVKITNNIYEITNEITNEVTKRIIELKRMKKEKY